MVRARARGGCEADRGRPACVFMCNEVAPEARGLQNPASCLAGCPTPEQGGQSREMQKWKNEYDKNEWHLQ